MPFSLLPQIPKTYHPYQAICEELHQYALFITFKVFSALPGQIYRAIEQARVKYKDSAVIAVSRQIYRLLTGAELNIYDVPKTLPSTQADVLVYVYSDDHDLATLQAEIQREFADVALLTDAANCCRFAKPHLDLCGRQFGPSYAGETPLFDADKNSYFAYLRYLRDVNYELYKGDEVEHLKTFVSDLLVHDYPAFTPKVQSQALVTMSGQLSFPEAFLRMYMGKQDADYVDPYLQAYSLVSCGFYVAPNVETFEEIGERLQAIAEDPEPVETPAFRDELARITKFKMEDDEEQEEDDLPEEEKDEPEEYAGDASDEYQEQAQEGDE